MAFIVKRDAVVIPAGIPVASTASVNISQSPYAYASPLLKGTTGAGLYQYAYSVQVNAGLVYLQGYSIGANEFQFDGIILIAPNTIFFRDGYQLLQQITSWTLSVFGDDEGSLTYSVLSTNPSTDSTTIPTVGWSPSFTITAA